MARAFPFGRKNINIENSTRASLEERLLQSGSGQEPGDDTDVEYLPAPTNLIVVSEQIVNRADGVSLVDVLLQWDDVTSAEDYEIWMSGEIT